VKRGVDHPPRLAGEALGRPLVAVAQVGDHGFEQLRAELADAAQLLDGGERDHALAGQLLRLLGELEQLHARGDTLLGPAERLRGAVLGQPAVEHRLLCEMGRYLKLASSCRHGGDERPVLLRITAGTVEASWIR
jgi:hypothetical protein